jgi:hypothetical protein
VQLIIDRRVTRRTAATFRTRVITDGVVPSLHVDYKNARIKQYHKQGRALRTETTINNTRDLCIGRSLHNLLALWQVGFQATDVFRTSNKFPMIARMARTHLTEYFVPPKWTDKGPRLCALATSRCRLDLRYWWFSVSNSAGSPITKCERC